MFASHASRSCRKKNAAGKRENVEGNRWDGVEGVVIDARSSQATLHLQTTRPEVATGASSLARKPAQCQSFPVMCG